jgi:hypothetical protein
MKTSIKKPFLAILFLLGIFMISGADSYGQTSQRIRFVFGTRSHPNSDGKGCEGDKGLCVLLYTTKDIGKVTDVNTGITEMSVEGDQMTFNILSDNSPAEQHENYFYVYSDITVPAEAARAFGYSSIIIKKGKYPLNKSRNPLGQTVLPVITR